MKLLFRQRIFSWLDSYDVFDENGNTLFTVKGVFALAHTFKIYDRNGQEAGMIRQHLLTILRPRFDILLHGTEEGHITKEISFFTPRFTLDFRGWQVKGDLFEWNYRITSGDETIATISKCLFRWSDTYEIDVNDPENALEALMTVVAIDAVKCSQKN